MLTILRPAGLDDTPLRRRSPDVTFWSEYCCIEYSFAEDVASGSCNGVGAPWQQFGIGDLILVHFGRNGVDLCSCVW